ncbi:MAG: hypothetical protein OEY70_06095 [Acidimicrobiia bacterium]|nr:hypothetical protein [Acidimicrobiia bacterium]
MIHNGIEFAAAPSGGLTELQSLVWVEQCIAMTATPELDAKLREVALLGSGSPKGPPSLRVCWASKQPASQTALIASDLDYATSTTPPRRHASDLPVGAGVAGRGGGEHGAGHAAAQECGQEEGVRRAPVDHLHRSRALGGTEPAQRRHDEVGEDEEAAAVDPGGDGRAAEQHRAGGEFHRLFPSRSIGRQI